MFLLSTKLFFVVLLWSTASWAAVPSSGPVTSVPPNVTAIKDRIQTDIRHMLEGQVPKDQFSLNVQANIQVELTPSMIKNEVTPPVYQLVEIPVLKSVNVHIVFDELLSLGAVTRAKATVQKYLADNYSNLSLVTYGQEIMRQTKSLQSIKSNTLKKKRLSALEEELWGYFRTAVWIISPILGTLLILSFLSQRKKRERYSSSPDRNALFSRFLEKPEIFQHYYNGLNQRQRMDLGTALRGPAFEHLLKVLGLPSFGCAEMRAERGTEILNHHDKNFSEFIKVAEWQQSRRGAVTKTTEPPKLSEKHGKFGVGLSVEELASFPNALIERVFSRYEDEELGKVLAKCSNDILDIVLDAMPESRKNPIIGFINTTRVEGKTLRF